MMLPLYSKPYNSIVQTSFHAVEESPFALNIFISKKHLSTTEIMAHEIVATPMATNHVNVAIQGVISPSIADEIHKNAVENGPGSTIDIIIRIEHAKYLKQTKADLPSEMKLKLVNALRIIADGGDISAVTHCANVSDSAKNRDDAGDDIKVDEPAAPKNANYGNGSKPTDNQFAAQRLDENEIARLIQAIKERDNEITKLKNKLKIDKSYFEMNLERKQNVIQSQQRKILSMQNKVMVSKAKMDAKIKLEIEQNIIRLQHQSKKLMDAMAKCEELASSEISD